MRSKTTYATCRPRKKSKLPPAPALRFDGCKTAAYGNENIQETKRSNQNEGVEEDDSEVSAATSDTDDVALTAHRSVQQIAPVVELQSERPWRMEPPKRRQSAAEAGVPWLPGTWQGLQVQTCGS